MKKIKWMDEFNKKKMYEYLDVEVHQDFFNLHKRLFKGIIYINNYPQQKL